MSEDGGWPTTSGVRKGEGKGSGGRGVPRTQRREWQRRIAPEAGSHHSKSDGVYRLRIPVSESERVISV